MDYTLPNEVWDSSSRFSGRSAWVISEPRFESQFTQLISTAERSGQLEKTTVIGGGDTANPIVANSKLPTSTEVIALASHKNTGFAIGGVEKSDIERLAAQRVKILAASYVSQEGNNSEIIARLEILNRRLAQRLPRVSDKQVAFLEGTVNEMKYLEQESREFDEFLAEL
ncbi:hypothetical protein ABQ039_011825 [Xanthomonas sp. WHRI 6108]|jgi:hypothetical protein|uniref:hypothetical protein n=1 Tax=Xanthomonas TaxID=338 RepID=UPI0016207C02|nr:hypothetical protein [Xanthomonas arboricola]MBB5673744.1 hypothetical protein [Xanthomonas arboricola]